MSDHPDDEDVPPAQARLLAFQAIEDPGLRGTGPQGESADAVLMMARQQVMAAETHLRNARSILDAGVGNNVLGPSSVRALQASLRQAVSGTLHVQSDILTAQYGMYDREDA